MLPASIPTLVSKCSAPRLAMRSFSLLVVLVVVLSATPADNLRSSGRSYRSYHYTNNRPDYRTSGYGSFEDYDSHTSYGGGDSGGFRHSYRDGRDKKGTFRTTFSWPFLLASSEF